MTEKKDTLINQIDDAGFDVAGIIVPVDVFDRIALELSELAARAEQGKELTRAQRSLIGMDIMCDRRKLLPPDVFAVMIDKNNHPVRIIHRNEATERLH